MSAEIIGPAKHLVALLRRHFTATGMPPVGSQWSFLCPEDVIQNFRVEGDVFETWLMGSKDTVFFKSLLNDCEHVQLLAEKIEPLGEVTQAIRDVHAALAKYSTSPHSARLSYVFSLLCEKQWFESISFIAQYENSIIVAQQWQFRLCPIASQFLHDLEAAILEMPDFSGEKPGKKLPDNGAVSDLCSLLARMKNGDTQISVALKFTQGNKAKANNLLRQARRFAHLWKTDN